MQDMEFQLHAPYFAFDPRGQRVQQQLIDDKIIERAKDLCKEEILLAMGGFHLMDMSKHKMEKILMRFKDLGVRYVGPCHCTGETQIKAFEKAYAEHFLRVGVGKVVRIKDLK